MTSGSRGAILPVARPMKACTKGLYTVDDIRAAVFAVRDTHGELIDPVYIGTLSGDYKRCLEILGYVLPGWLNVIRQYRTSPDRAMEIAKSGEVDGWFYGESMDHINTRASRS